MTTSAHTSSLVVNGSIPPKIDRCAQGLRLMVNDGISPKNQKCAQSWQIDMAAIQSPSTDNRRRPGGARPGAGRPSSYAPLVAQQMTEYVKTTAYPSVKHFAETHGYRRATVMAWELQGHRELLNALGALRYQQELDMGKAA